MSAVPLSVLDLVLISSGTDAASSLQSSIELAREADALGYRRFWTAEHHLFPGGAGAAGYLLGPIIARETKQIRVGTAVLVIDNYSPLQVAEIAGTIAALGGRGFDLGIGRGGPTVEQRAGARETTRRLLAGELAPGPVGPNREEQGVVLPAPTRSVFNDHRAGLNDRLLSRTPGAPADFDEQVRDVLAFLDGSYPSGDGSPVYAVPAHGADVDLWVHGSSPGISATVAGSRGQRFGANYHNIPYSLLATVAAYREAFVPSAQLQAPYVVVSVDVLVAETDAEAERRAAPFGHWLLQSRRDYAAGPYPSPEEALAAPLTDEERAIVSDRVASRIVGSPQTVAARLRAIVDATGADELVVTTSAHSLADRIESYRLLAEVWGGAEG
ncbi:LLM class flavin-dependent oxidoreductase [Plantibacter sp. Mn2098]|uniref:LLM class flavin-dependent oxidoreductase n=1 Tax=Plantibacter sp. Mn2098 TaxID=3395266 RepID=UPI003BD2E364